MQKIEIHDKWKSKAAFKRSGGKILNSPLTLFGASWDVKKTGHCVYCFRKLKKTLKGISYCNGTKRYPHRSFALKEKP